MSLTIIIIIIVTHLALFSSSGANEIFNASYGEGRSTISHEYFKTTEDPRGSGIVKFLRQIREDEITESTQIDNSSQSDVEEPDDGSSRLNVKFLGESDRPAVPSPIWGVFKPLIDKFTNIVNYLTHPNVAATPFYLLSRLKQKIYEHVRDKLGDPDEYPYAYKFNLN